MKPIAIFQHTEVGAPGAVIPILRKLGFDIELIKIVDGEPVPKTALPYAGLVFMGGYMGVGDDLPWIPMEIALVRDADARGLPVAGHCLGSQLVAAAFGANIERNKHPEIGWQLIKTGNDAISREWWGNFANKDTLVFQWHGDMFRAPADGKQIATAAHCDSQAYIVHNRHMLLQSHLEMTPKLVRLSMERNGDQLIRQFELKTPSVSDPKQLLLDLERRTRDMNDALFQLYSRWIRGCVG